MKKIILSFMAVAALLTGCSQNTAETTPLVTKEDTVAHSVGVILATDALYSDLVDYSDMIDEAVNDIFNGNVQKISEAYAYINALEIVNRAYFELDNKLDKDIILESAHALLANVHDSLDFESVHATNQAAQTAVLDYVHEKMSKVHDQYLSEVDKVEGIQKSESGLRYIVDNQGTKIGENDVVKVNYTLYDYSRNVIDKSKLGSPFEFQLPTGVVPGFAEAVTIAGYGGKIRAWVPAALGYGDEGQGQIAPGQTLIFEIEVLQK